MITCIKQDATGDIVFENGRLLIEDDPGEVAAIRIKNAFGIGLGESVLDSRIGVPYLDLVLVKRPNLAIIRGLFQKIILSVENVVSVPVMELTFDKATRSLDFEFEAKINDGSTVTGGSVRPFIVTAP
jgi:hypothetical protein